MTETFVEWPQFQPRRDVELCIPADWSLVRLARLAGSALAASCGFDLDELEDVKVFVGEVCATLIELGDGSPLTLRLGTIDGIGVWLDGRTPTKPDGSVDAARFTLTERILEVICDRHELDTTGREARFRVVRFGTPAADEEALDRG